MKMVVDHQKLLINTTILLIFNNFFYFINVLLNVKIKTSIFIMKTFPIFFFCTLINDNEHITEY
jgi:hypothetical protein